MLLYSLLSESYITKSSGPDNISPRILKECAHHVMAVNYRPISLTSIVVKTLERMFHKHIMNFLSELRLLCENQHAWLQKVSIMSYTTVTASIPLVLGAG
jgi:hypothetical protein